jgi:hypothetical protein
MFGHVTVVILFIPPTVLDLVFMWASLIFTSLAARGIVAGGRSLRDRTTVIATAALIIVVRSRNVRGRETLRLFVKSCFFYK